jgi:hypothetical protein
MINPSPIDLHAAAHCARPIFESMDTSVLAKQDRSHVDPLAHSSPDQNTSFFRSTAFWPARTLAKPSLRTHGSSLTTNPLYNLHRKR